MLRIIRFLICQFFIVNSPATAAAMDLDGAQRYNTLFHN
jgi:hypothetical protein